MLRCAMQPSLYAAAECHGCSVYPGRTWSACCVQERCKRRCCCRRYAVSYLSSPARAPCSQRHDLGACIDVPPMSTPLTITAHWLSWVRAAPCVGGPPSRSAPPPSPLEPQQLPAAGPGTASDRAQAGPCQPPATTWSHWRACYFSSGGLRVEAVLVPCALRCIDAFPACWAEAMPCKLPFHELDRQPHS